MHQEPRDINHPPYSTGQQHYQQHQHSSLQQSSTMQQNTALQQSAALQQNSTFQNSAPKLHAALQQQAAQQTQSFSDAPSTNAFSAYGAGIRKQVFELVVQQALAGASWRDLCAAHMRINLISPQEIEQEVQRRNKANQPQSLQHAWLEHKARLNSIRHSEQSPCACNSCLTEVLKMREFVYAKSKLRAGL